MDLFIICEETNDLRYNDFSAFFKMVYQFFFLKHSLCCLKVNVKAIYEDFLSVFTKSGTTIETIFFKFGSVIDNSFVVIFTGRIDVSSQ